MPRQQPRRSRPSRASDSAPAPSRADSPSGAPARSRAHRPARADPARRAAYDALRAVTDRDAYANLLLPALLAERGLTGRDAAFATELTYGTLRGRGTYDAILAACSDRDQLDPPVRDILRLGAHQLLATRVGHHAAVATSVDLTRDVCGPRPSGFVNAVLRRVATRDLDAWMAIVTPDRSLDPSGYLAVRHSYPRWIVDAFRDALGDASHAELEDALAAGNSRPEVVLAVTPGLPGPPDPMEAADSTRWSPYGLRLAGGDPAPIVATGRAAVQDEASQLAALALARAELAGPAGQDRLWLDLCAGPGGKARLLAGLAATRGARLVASEVRPHRAKKVRSALRRARRDPSAAAPDDPGRPNSADDNSADHNRADHNSADHNSADHNSAVVVADGLGVPWRPGTFDRVLADVPCSGLGSLRRRPEARWRKTPAGVSALASLQRGLLDAALDSARPGGVVAYVTCSPHVAETREVVTAVADSRADVTILDAPAVLAEVPGLRAPGRWARFAQFWPHRHGTDAIFLALLRRD
ncbi:MAG TPA: RsmB/NOP family class I SAM-dependent RNA methyltransferase [Streptosporangiaceae bacterium]|nr:RsmB/NOP family class I SAM-dependent RNA methyltransferase [Streptosporangiaceae bacterium]